MASLFQGRTEFVVRGALDGLAARHRVYVDNLANVETPGFVPGEVPFESELREARDRMGRGPASFGAPPRLTFEWVAEVQQADRVDRNGVQADTQVMQLVENSLGYEALLQAQRLRAELLRATITEGRK